MTRQPQASARFMTYRQVEEYLHVTERTLRRWIGNSEKPLPYVKLGGRVLFDRSAVDAWVHQFRMVGSLPAAWVEST